MKKYLIAFLFIIITFLFISISQHGVEDVFNNVKINGDLTVDGNINFAEQHASFGFQDSATVLAATVNNPSHITNADNTLWGTQDADGITRRNDTFIVALSGHFNIETGVSFSTGGGADNWRVSIAINGSQQGFGMPRKTSSNDVGYFGTGATFDLTAGDKITIEITNTSDNDDPTIIGAWCLICFLHE